MRHLQDVNEMADALAAEFEKLGEQIERREDGIFLVFKTDRDCGAHSVTEVNVTNLAVAIWEAMS